MIATLFKAAGELTRFSQQNAVASRAIGDASGRRISLVEIKNSFDARLNHRQKLAELLNANAGRRCSALGTSLPEQQALALP